MTGPRAAPRQASIDVLRAAAIVLMTLVHFVENLAGSWEVVDGAFIGANRYWWMPTGFAAPLFTFLSGVSYRLWADAQRARGRDDDEVSKITARRGLFLILFGFAFNVLVWLPEDVFNWDILTLIGTAMLALEVVRRAPPAAPLVACGLLVGLAPVLRAAADYRSFWAAGYFDYDFTLADVVLGYLATGYFPVFPWLALPLAGYAAAPLVYGTHAGRSQPTPWLAGGLLVAAAAAVMALRPLVPARLVTHEQLWSMFPPTTGYVLGTIGGMILLAAALHRTLDARSSGSGPLVRIAGAMSRHSLSLYVLHHVAHMWPLWLAEFVAAGEPDALWQVATPVPTALAWAVAFLLLAAWLAERMDRPGAPSAESLLRWLCEP
ncbi:MAG: heparan-alpha-glucosaminide N-acetyltransferase domain-containing protein [Planctomycetota bacterium]